MRPSAVSPTPNSALMSSRATASTDRDARSTALTPMMRNSGASV
jgi:hypothetical protein